MGEKFGANPVTGTGSLSVPLAVSPGRSGFGPQISLAYDSGSENGPFGFGWSHSLPQISRKTDKGLPRYFDRENPDTFLLSGAEDLVPVLVKQGGGWQRDAHQRRLHGREYEVTRYRPRVEGLFARIECWSNRSNPADSFWRSITKDNHTTWYGKTAESRVADPEDPQRIYSWLICESSDDRGNVIIYRYASEDSAGVDSAQAHERNRTPLSRSANRHIKRVCYGNRTPYHPRLAPDEAPTPLPDDWMFEVVFDYGEHHVEEPTPQPEQLPRGEARVWDCRPDPFSTYRAGFEIRTYRLCRRVLMFHHFPELGDTPCLVRSTNFHYSFETAPPDPHRPVFSFLAALNQTGYRHENGGYVRRSLPPLEFGYTQPELDEQVHTLDAESLRNLPQGLDENSFRFVDIDGEGISGILTEQSGTWFYKSNLGEGRFGPLQRLVDQPSLANLGGSDQQFLDLAGDGKLELVQFSRALSGFYERSDPLDAGELDGWNQFTPFTSLPDVNWDDPNLRFVDLTGDGLNDILIAKDQSLIWHPSFGEAGFGPSGRVHQELDEETGPRLVFTDGMQSFYLADFSGDGLTDLVRIRNGEVSYWPNLGYGCFGKRVTMDNAPWFDQPDLFHPRRVLLADVDGSGVTDIVYLAHDGARLYFNLSGNSWSEPHTIASFPRNDPQSAVTVADLLGNGTACLVWSSPLPGAAGRPLRYIDLMGGQKPHLLVRSTNNLGAETRVHYAPSTRFYLQDKQTGVPWITRLPFPVHVVERVETFDFISRSHFVTRYAYHHGYFDGAEREFRGFGLVEQWDTEEFAALSASDEFPLGENITAASHVPPVYTRTWFHTGAYLEAESISRQYAGEYYGAPDPSGPDYAAKYAAFQASLLPDTLLPAGLDPDEQREAVRALKGALLRREIYGLDGTPQARYPYSASENSFAIRRLQPRSENLNAVFFTHPQESITHHFERNPNDPRVVHELNLVVDDFGNVERSLTVAYPRSPVPERLPEQAQTHMLLATSRYANRPSAADWYRISVQVEVCSYEVAYAPEAKFIAGALQHFSFSEMLAMVSDLFPPGAERPPHSGLLSSARWDWRGDTMSSTTPRLRLVEHARNLYRKDDLSGPLPLGEIESMALQFSGYTLAFTPEILEQIFVEAGKASHTDLEKIMVESGGFTISNALKAGGLFPPEDSDGELWLPDGLVYFSPDPLRSPAQELEVARFGFFLVRRIVDPFGFETQVHYDRHHLLVLEVENPLHSRVTAGERLTGGEIRNGNDYRVLQPALITDPNGNRSAIVFDALGMVAGSAVMGKPGETVGDTLAGFRTDLEPAEIERFFADPRGEFARSLLAEAGSRIIYDVQRFARSPGSCQPVYAASLKRETHAADPEPPGGLRFLVSISYSDGFGRETQQKAQTEPGPVEAGGPEINPRWVTSGWTIYNNKGKPVRQYEPFFSASHDFEFGRKAGVSPVLFYDPAERVVAALHPNHIWEKTVYNPWRQEAWDVNDTVLAADPAADPDVGGFFQRLDPDEYLPTWYAMRKDGGMGADEQEAARKAAVHAATPSVAHFDSLRRAFETVAHNRQTAGGPDKFFTNRNIQDIEGNQRIVIDALGRAVMRFEYNLTGGQIYQASMEAGEHWMLGDAAGLPLFGWDNNGQRLRMLYDELHRPTETYLQTEDGTERLVERLVYGESQPDPESSNLRGEVFRQLDQAGMVTNEEYDFKGNQLRTKGQLAREYRATLDWSGEVPLESQVYVGATRYDALNRPVEMISPDNSRIIPSYNEGSLLERVVAHLRGADDPEVFITRIDYDAKGQRVHCDYGNGVQTHYRYDPLTLRLLRLRSRRDPARYTDDCPQPASPAWPGCDVQDLIYTYDPAGNITRIRDGAQQTVFFRNRRVDPTSDYTYDAIYRLIEASGREHLGQTGGEVSHPAPDAFDAAQIRLDHPGDGHALGRYLENYLYDAVGNLLAMQHRGTDPAHPGWTRSYRYEEASSLEPEFVSNRLTRTFIGDNHHDHYSYDASGNMIHMPHLSLMLWDYNDQLQASARQVVNEGTPETTWYVYDTSGQRIRKVTDRKAGLGEPPTRKTERIYLGNFEIYREYAADGETVAVERETLHVMDGYRRVAQVETRTHGEDNSPPQLTRYQISNHLGSSALELDTEGRIITYEEYTPFGSTAYQAVRSQTETPKRYRYSGKERDEENGLYYHGVRYYAPWLGRWTAADPAELVDGPNLYVYARDNPVMNRDSTGADSDTDELVCIDPTTPTSLEEQLQSSLPEGERNFSPNPEPTEREQALQQSLPEDERYLPDPSTPTELEEELQQSLLEDERYSPHQDDLLVLEEYENEEYVEQVEIKYTEEEDTGIRYAAAGTLTWIGGDTLTPEPTDFVVPKWVGYAVAGVAALAVVAFTSPTIRTRTRVEPRVRTRRRRRNTPLTYITYTLSNPSTGEIYVGRSAGYGTPQQILDVRYIFHHKRFDGFENPQLDQSRVATQPFSRRHSDPSYQAIRGREQMVIDAFGGSWTAAGGRGNTRSGNAIAGVSILNRRYRIYMAAALANFGPVNTGAILLQHPRAALVSIP